MCGAPRREADFEGACRDGEKQESNEAETGGGERAEGAGKDG